jgi:hypothetical protein
MALADGQRVTRLSHSEVGVLGTLSGKRGLRLAPWCLGQRFFFAPCPYHRNERDQQSAPQDGGSNNEQSIRAIVGNDGTGCGPKEGNKHQHTQAFANRHA